jgi:hypothetical protein
MHTTTTEPEQQTPFLRRPRLHCSTTNADVQVSDLSDRFRASPSQGVAATQRHAKRQLATSISVRAALWADFSFRDDDFPEPSAHNSAHFLQPPFGRSCRTTTTIQFQAGVAAVVHRYCSSSSFVSVQLCGLKCARRCPAGDNWTIKASKLAYCTTWLAGTRPSKPAFGRRRTQLEARL